MKPTDKNARFFEAGLLDPEYHQKLVDSMAKIAAKAHVPSRYIYEVPLNKYCQDPDIEWVKNFRSLAMKGLMGMAYIGEVTRVDDRMYSIAGAMLRNYIHAQVLTVQEFMDSVKFDRPVEASVLLIPNFYLSKDNGGRIPEWQVALLNAALLRRQGDDKQTVIYVENMDRLASDYGDLIHNHVANHFYQVS